jgi:dTDP-L-rhamnose 4-epimerase
MKLKNLPAKRFLNVSQDSRRNAMKILILGGAGMIGQAIAKKHIQSGDDVDIFDLFLNPYTSHSPQYGQLVDEVIVEKYDLISNQASLVGVGESMYRPHDYLSNNVGETGKLIQLIINSKKKIPIIHAGSMGPYGEGKRRCKVCYKEFTPCNIRTRISIPCPVCGCFLTSPLHIHEDDTKAPQSIYAISKLAQEEALRVFSQAYGNPVVSLRYFSVYATDQNPMNPMTGVLSIIGNQILNCNKVEINEDGQQTRDLIHVEDVAKAHFLASRDGTPPTFTYYNIGTGVNTSMISIASAMCKKMGKDLPIYTNNEVRRGDIRDSKADILKAARTLGFRYRVGIEQSIDEYCLYLLEHEKEFKTDSWAIEQKRIREGGLQ